MGTCKTLVTALRQGFPERSRRAQTNGSYVEFIQFFPFVVSLSNHIHAFCKYLLS